MHIHYQGNLITLSYTVCYKTSLTNVFDTVILALVFDTRNSAGNGAVDAGVSLRPPVNLASGRAPMYLCTAAAQN